MEKRTKRLSNIAIITVLVLTLSSSFCLRLLSGLALAADIHAFSPQLAVSIVSDCSQDVAMSVSDGQQLTRTTAAASTPECCLNQSHKVNAIASQTVASDDVLLAVLLADGPLVVAPAPTFHRQVVSLPPPQADGLRSVVKRE